MKFTHLSTSLLLIASFQLLLIHHVWSGIPLPHRQIEEANNSSSVQSRKLLQDENVLKLLSNHRHKAPLFSAAANFVTSILFSLSLMSLLLFVAYVGYLKYRMHQISELQEGKRITLDENDGEKEPINEQYLQKVYRDQFSSLNKFPTVSPSQCKQHSWNEIPITNEIKDPKDVVIDKAANRQPEISSLSQSEHKKQDPSATQSQEKNIDDIQTKPSHEKKESQGSIKTEVVTAENTIIEGSKLTQISPGCSRSKSDPNTHETCSQLSDKEKEFFSADEFQTADEGEEEEFLNAALEDTNETGIKPWDKIRHALAFKMRLKPEEVEVEVKKTRGRKKTKAKKTPARRSGRK